MSERRRCPSEWRIDVAAADLSSSWPAWDDEHDPAAAWKALLEDVRGLADGLDEYERLGSQRPPPEEERESVH